MEKLLLRLLGGDSPKEVLRVKIGKLSGVCGIFANFFLFLAKIAIGTVSGSVAITADAMNNLSDSVSSVVTFLGFRLAEKPADADHPYGHARFEYLSGLAVAALIVVIGVELGKSSLDKILHPTPITLSLPLFLVLGLSILVKLALCYVNRTAGKAIDSTTLLATAADSRNDVISTGAVLLAAAVQGVTGWQIDGYVGMAVAVFILYSGCVLGKETISPLLGEATSPQLRRQIIDLLDQVPQVLGFHDLMVHDYGPGQRFASMHVEMSNEEDPLFCHDLIDNIERACLDTLGVHLVIHYDPVVTGDAQLTALRERVQAILQAADSRISMHDFRMVSGPGHTNLIFDVVLPEDLWSTRDTLKQTIEKTLAAQDQGVYYTVITFDLAAFN